MRSITGTFKFLATVVLSVVLGLSTIAQDATNGEKLFGAQCTSCHMLGGVLIGPNLEGVTKRWSKDEELISFIKNSQGVINGGNVYAQNLYKKYNNTVMPSFALSTEEIKDILAYVDGGSAEGAEVAAEGTGMVAEAFSDVPKSNPFNDILLLVIVVITALIVVFIIRLIVANSKLKELSANNDSTKGGSLLQKVNAILFPVFMVALFYAIFYETGIHSKFLRPEAASEHGKEIDNLFNITLIITAIVFFATQIALFVFAYLYRKQNGKKAFYYPHNNTLELVWTTIPAVVLAGVVLYGFQTWSKSTSSDPNPKISIEAFAKQFDWTFRYPGPDNKLGRTNFLLISDTNPLGIDFADPASKDDYLTTELVLPKDEIVEINLRSRDVLHAIYLPHFRAQIYAQPGLETKIQFRPLFTTAEFRKKIEKPEFEFEMACNQICGAAHWNMRRVVTVHTLEDFNKWLTAEDKVAEFIKQNPNNTVQTSLVK